MQRSAMRELAFKLIYGIEIQKEIEEDTLELFFENNNIIEEETQDYLKEIKEGIAEHKEEINELISHNLKENWSFNRVSKINLSLIKIAIFEMLYLDLPYKIAINEVVELAKKYADDQAPVFINGILASVVKEKRLDGDTDES
ncbi:MAG: transcription antitermination factor NusB [Clostridia bacterium]|nr:transcription antitermination factor NusB [Clostridia bacterium]